MTATTATTILGRSRMSRRGFGLVDVSLGIIAGIALLVGAVILFQGTSKNCPDRAAGIEGRGHSASEV